MPLYQDENVGLSTRDRSVQPPDLLARSGLPVPEWKSELVPAFNADLRRLIARISSLFALIAPTAQGAPESANSLALVAHAPQHEAGGGDELNIEALTAIGISTGEVLRATSPSAYAFDRIQLLDLPDSVRTGQFLSSLRKTEINASEKDVVHIAKKLRLLSWVVASDTIANIQYDVWRANLAVPTSGAQSIIGAGNKPKLVGQNFRKEDVAGWTDTTLTEDDVLVLNVDSVSGFSATSIVTLGLTLIQIP